MAVLCELNYKKLVVQCIIAYYEEIWVTGLEPICREQNCDLTIAEC